MYSGTTDTERVEMETVSKRSEGWWSDFTVTTILPQKPELTGSSSIEKDGQGKRFLEWQRLASSTKQEEHRVLRQKDDGSKFQLAE
jgi:hypothetical protein